ISGFIIIRLTLWRFRRLSSAARTRLRILCFHKDRLARRQQNRQDNQPCQHRMRHCLISHGLGLPDLPCPGLPVGFRCDPPCVLPTSAMLSVSTTSCVVPLPTMTVCVAEDGRCWRCPCPPPPPPIT